MTSDAADAAAVAPVTLYLLHALGASARSFDALRDRLAGVVDVRAIDLPGFGDADSAADTSLEASTEAVIAVLARHGGGRFLLGGHSMGGKIAALAASRILSGREAVFGLVGMVLLAPSPPTPEPMAEERRERMLAWAADGPLDVAQAQEFVAQNVARPLDDEAQDAAVADLRRASPAAWTAWLRTGSRVDVAPEVGGLDLPTLVLAGTDDEDLGAAAQPGLLARAFPRARHHALADTGHLLPSERTSEVADAIVRFVQEEVTVAPEVPPAWGRLAASDRTDVEVRMLLARRAIPDDPSYRPTVLDETQLRTLRDLADAAVPQRDSGRIDLAVRVDAQLARGEGDGWRNDALPPDPEAYRRGLDTLSAVWDGTDPAALGRAIDGEARVDGPLDAAQLSLWLEDARVDLVRAWLAHPASMARIGYDGFATGGTVLPLRGFTELAAGSREDWEPADVAADGRVA